MESCGEYPAACSHREFDTRLPRWEVPRCDLLQVQKLVEKARPTSPPIDGRGVYGWNEPHRDGTLYRRRMLPDVGLPYHLQLAESLLAVQIAQR